MKKYINVSFCFNDGYIKYASTAIYSLLKNTKSNIHIFILSDYLSEENTTKLKKLVSKFPNAKIDIFTIDIKSISSLKICLYTGIATYYRLLLDKYIENIDKLIYLDSDIIVKGDIKELRDINLGNNIVGAYPEDIEDETDCLYNHIHTSLGLNSYFNSGVLLIDCKKWKQEKISEKAIKYISTNPQSIIIADQDGLNVVLEGKWKAIGDKYNFENRSFLATSKKKYFNEDIIVRHYTGAIKPWHLQYIFYYNDKIKQLKGYDVMEYLSYYYSANKKNFMYFLKKILFILLSVFSNIGIYGFIIFFYRKFLLKNESTLDKTQ